MNAHPHRYGAPMGSPSFPIPDSLPDRSIRLALVPINAGGYDRSGTYWGLGMPLYYASWETDTDSQSAFIRASCRYYAARKLHIPESKLIRQTIDPDLERLDAVR